MIFGVSGALRCCELVNLTVKDISYHGDLIKVDVRNTKNYVNRFFTIDAEFSFIVKKYLNLRPAKCTTSRLFLSYNKGACKNQPIGKNTFSKYPSQIAKFLNLQNSERYTGHSFRRTSATILADTGADITTLKRHGGWKTNTSAEGYIEESLNYKQQTMQKITSSIKSAQLLPSQQPLIPLQAQDCNDVAVISTPVMTIHPNSLHIIPMTLEVEENMDWDEFFLVES